MRDAPLQSGEGTITIVRPAAETPAERPRPVGHARVLVLDPEPAIRRGCQRVLGAEGYEVLSAETVEKALALMRALPELEVALVDLRMPGGPPEAPEWGGLTFLSAAQAERPTLVCCVLSAYATIETAMEATRRGAYDFLAKPFLVEDLYALVRRAAERAHLLQERQRLMAERERRLLQLATEQSRLRGIINSLADGVLICNAEEELVLYNPAALRVLQGLQPGQEAYPLASVLAAPELLELIREVQRTQGRLSREIPLGEGPPEERQWVLASVTPVTDERSGAFQGTVTVLRDITALRRVQEIKAQFVNMVAHELRAPLAAIDGYLAVLAEGLVTSPEKQKEILCRSRQRLKALQDLVNDLLEVARLEAGRVRRQIEPLAVEALIAEALQLWQPVAQEKNVHLESEIIPPLPVIEADRTELLRLLGNLIENGIKYNRPGGRVRLSAVAEGPYVRFTVADTGIGIRAENLPLLFTEFFREKRPETAQVTGTGLGLSLVKRIVDFYHGRIDVASQEGQGTTFTIWLPCHYQPAAAEEA